MMIVNQPDVARFVTQNGVDRVFVDLEYLGKSERQGHLDTWISRHVPEDISRVRVAIGSAQLLVRLNPWHDRSADEIEDALARGADILMLPMFREIAELESFCRTVRGRAPVIPLVETAEAFARLTDVARTDGVAEVFIGLNDLHLSLGMRFMFEPLANGMMDRASEQLHAVGKPFGFGGVARVGEGLLPAERILGEHVRLGSTAVILSRTFHRQAATLEEMRSQMDFARETQKLQRAYADFLRASSEEIEANRREVKRIVALIMEKSG
jgi:2-keto-3-deoxy-L-rhamnonate aldolase RhmA